MWAELRQWKMFERKRSPISDYISEEELGYSEVGIGQTNWNGKQWGIPAYGFTYGIAYDKEAMRTAGVDPENPFTTWDEFLEVGEIKIIGNYAVRNGLKDGYLPAWIGIFGTAKYGQRE